MGFRREEEIGSIEIDFFCETKKNGREWQKKETH
jgi:hypothetical protein